MQPPPRKGNYVKFLKSLHSEQIAKLQAKNQHECELLEDIRQFTIKRSAIEKTYSEALLKISSAYLNKKMPLIPDIKVEGGEEKWNMWSVWRTVLEENEKLARARLAALEVFHQQIADEVKTLRAHKIAIARKTTEQLAAAQKELQACVSDVDKTEKLYFDEENSAHDVRDKARDIEDKLKKKKGSFFQSITSLQKNSAKVSSRRDQLEEKSTGARNSYIFSLAAANSHQTRYFLVELSACLSALEAGIFERVADWLALMGRTELLTVSAALHSFGKIRDRALHLERDYNLQCCYLYYPALKRHIQYSFVACAGDPIRKITAEPSDTVLSVAARRWASKLAREERAARIAAAALTTALVEAESGIVGVVPDSEGGTQAASASGGGSGQHIPPASAESRADEARANLRRAETAVLHCKARLDCLRDAGLPIDEWLRDGSLAGADSNIVDVSDSADAAETSETGETSEAGSADRGGSAVGGGVGRGDSGSEAGGGARGGGDDDWDEDVDEDVDAAIAAAQASPPTSAKAAPSEQTFGRCTVLYNYTAQNPDELTVIENEQLELVEAVEDGEAAGGWLRARNHRGIEGLVPLNYLDLLQGGGGGGGEEISFSSVDYTVGSWAAWEEDPPETIEEPITTQPEAQPQVEVEPPTFVESKPPVQEAPVLEQSEPPSMPPSAPPSEPPPSAPPDQAYQFCRALYDYEAEAADELTFEEGQIIRIISQHGNPANAETELDQSEDEDAQTDGWWWGELDGKIGAFPSLVVEECDEEGEPLEGEMTPDCISPVASPPPVAPPAGPPLSPPLSLPATDTPETPDIISASPSIPTPQIASPPNGEVSEEAITPPAQPSPQQMLPKLNMGLVNGKTVENNEEDMAEAEEPELEKLHQIATSETTAKSARTAARQANANQTLGLPAATIVITAATPVCEESAQNWADKGELEADDEDEEDQEEDSVVEAVSKVPERTASGTGGGGAEDVPEDLEPRRLARLAKLGESDA